MPGRILLKKKGVSTPILCPMCGVDIEHVRHLFCECTLTKECWQRAGLNIDMQQVEVASDWMLDMLGREDMGKLEKMVIVLSGIWFAKNKKVWESKMTCCHCAKQW